MLTIGYDASVTLDERTGIGRFTLELLRALLDQAAPDERYVVLLNSYRQRPGPEHEFLFRHPRAIVRRRRLPGTLLVRAWNNRVLAPSFETVVGQACDVVHAPAGYIPPTRARLVATVHDLGFLRDPEDRLSPLGSGLFKRTWPALLPKAAAITTDCEFVRQDVIRHHPKVAPGAIHPIFCGVDHALAFPLQPRAEGGAPYFLSVTAEEPRKRIELLLEAYAMARRELGEGAPPLKVRGLGAGRTLPPGVEAVARQSDQGLAGYYGNAIAKVLTSREEGFGFPVLEAMAAGCPVICGRNSSLTEIGDGAAAFVQEESAAAFAAAMVDAARRSQAPGERERLRAHAERFTWAAAARAYRELYRSLV